MSRTRSKERCFCKDEEVYCRFANTNPTCIYYQGLRQCYRDAKNSFDMEHIRNCHPSPSCGFKCCYKESTRHVDKKHCMVVREDHKAILFND